MKIVDCVQGSPEWLKARCGIPSASNFDKIITTKGIPSAQRQKYMYQLAGERILGKHEETYKSAAMQRGTEMEEEARMFYEMVSGNQVEKCGFFYTDGFGASPDGLIGDDGLLEIKCPMLATHVSYLLEEKLPTDYFQQVQGELLSTERKWADFVSYYPGMRPLIVRVLPHEKFQRELKIELELFCDQLEDLIKQIG